MERIQAALNATEGQEEPSQRLSSRVSQRRSMSSSSTELSINDSEFEWLKGYFVRERSKHDSIDVATVQTAVDEAASLQRARGTKHALDDAPSNTLVKDLNLSVYDDHDDDDQAEGKRQKKIVWTNTEDLTILAGVRRIGTQWPRIANHLPGRTADAVRNRWHRLQRLHTLGDSEEGRAAIDSLLVASGIDPNWSPIEEEGGSADAASAKRGSEHGRINWTPEEDRLIEEGVKKHGCKWRVIAMSMPGRSDSSVRNRWMRICKEIGESSMRDLSQRKVSGASASDPISLAKEIEAMGVDGVPLGQGAPELLVDMNMLFDAVVGMLPEEGESPHRSADSVSKYKPGDAKFGTDGLAAARSPCSAPRLSTLFPCPTCFAPVGEACRQ